MPEKEVRRYVAEKLFMFVDNEIVIEHGSYFSVNENKL